jgi:hypothetical protein
LLILLNWSDDETAVLSGNRLAIPKPAASPDFLCKFFEGFEWGGGKSCNVMAVRHMIDIEHQQEAPY